MTTQTTNQPETKIVGGITLYWCKPLNCYVTIPDEYDDNGNAR